MMAVVDYKGRSSDTDIRISHKEISVKQWLAKLFGKKNNTESMDTGMAFPVPWESHRQSIYRFLSPYAQGSEPLPESAEKLPDDKTEEGELRWVAGGMDGAFGHHGGGGGTEETAEQLLVALSAAAESPTKGNMLKLYNLLKDASPLDYIDTLMEKLPQTSSLSPQKVRDLMQWLAMESPDRNPVKCAIAVLAFFPSEENQALVSTLGLHEEFTLYSAVALHNMLPAESHESAFLALAKRVTGWGRIQLIERLPDELSDSTRDWLLREGYSNAVMAEYTAWDCATKGQLLTVLMSGKVDAGLISGIGDILSALIYGGPARDIDDYADGALACHHYLALIRQSDDDNVRNLLAAGVIGSFVSDTEKDWESLQAQGWSADIRQKIDEDAQAILAQPKWRAVVERDLTVNNTHEFYLTTRAAKLLGIETWDVIFARQSAAAQENNWYELMQTDDPQRLERLLSLAESQFDLAAIATGPDTQPGVGYRYQQHNALDFILQDLNRFPGMGWKIIKTGLHSPVVRNRYMALNAIESWSSEQHPTELAGLLDRAIQLEPDEEIRERLEKLLAGESA